MYNAEQLIRRAEKRIKKQRAIEMIFAAFVAGSVFGMVFFHFLFYYR